MSTQENDYMVPFSPDRTPNSTDSPGERGGGTSGFSTVTPERGGALAAAPPARATGSNPDVSPAVGPVDGDGGGGGAGALLAEVSDTKQFCFSDDDESEADEKDKSNGDPASTGGGSTNPMAKSGGSGSGSGLVGGGGNIDANRTISPGGKREVAGSACATPAPRTWDAPDFGFSSDEDLDMDFSASEKSSHRSLERSRSRSSEVGKKTGE